MTQPSAGKNTLWLVELKFFQKKLIIATKRKTPSERVWKTRSEKGVFFLCTILFEVTWAFWKTWWQTTEQISIYGHFCLIFYSSRFYLILFSVTANFSVDSGMNALSKLKSRPDSQTFIQFTIWLNVSSFQFVYECENLWSKFIY